METRSNRSDGARQNIGGLRVAHLLKIAEHDDLAISDREAQDGLSHPLYPFSPCQVAKGVRLQSSVTTRVVFLVQRLKGTVAIETLPGAISRDATQPCSHPRTTGLVTPSLPHDNHEHILRDIVGGARRSRHVQREPVDLPVPASKQKPEGLSIAFCGPREQILVGVPIGFRILILIAW